MLPRPLTDLIVPILLAKKSLSIVLQELFLYGPLLLENRPPQPAVYVSFPLPTINVHMQTTSQPTPLWSPFLSPILRRRMTGVTHPNLRRPYFVGSPLPPLLCNPPLSHCHPGFLGNQFFFSFQCLHPVFEILLRTRVRRRYLCFTTPPHRARFVSCLKEPKIVLQPLLKPSPFLSCHLFWELVMCTPSPTLATPTHFRRFNRAFCTRTAPGTNSFWNFP